MGGKPKAAPKAAKKKPAAKKTGRGKPSKRKREPTPEPSETTESELESESGQEEAPPKLPPSHLAGFGGFGPGAWLQKSGGTGFDAFRASIPGGKQPSIPDSILTAPEPDHKEVLRIVSQLDMALKPIVEEEQCGKPLDIGLADGKDLATLQECYSSILKRFASKRYRDWYSASPRDLAHFSITPGAPVPSYFANVSFGTMYERKILSILGLRNLLTYGPVIFGDLQKAEFRSCPDAYEGDSGLGLMKLVTGNAVDLDTCVLRCSDGAVLKTVNELNKKDGLTGYKNGDGFGRSKQAREMAVTAARPLLVHFCETLGLAPARQRKRLVDPGSLSADSIPVATHNTDRGRWPLWQYVNAGQNSFHANVPNLKDVIGSLLLAPYHLAAAYSTVALAQDKDGDSDSCFDAFFEDCVVDACFNLKWKAIEEFTATLRARDTIGTQLALLQKMNQSVFSAIYDDDALSSAQKDEAEVAALWKLAAGIRAREVSRSGAESQQGPKPGKRKPNPKKQRKTTHRKEQPPQEILRAVTRADVVAWVADPTSVP